MVWVRFPVFRLGNVERSFLRYNRTVGTKRGEGKKVICSVCSKLFTAQGKRITCSAKCRDELKTQRFPLLPAHKCEYVLCSNELSASSIHAYRKFCSNLCRRQARKPPRIDIVTFDGNYLQISGPCLDGHPALNKWGIARVHVVLAYDKYGFENLQCHWCKCELEWKFGKFQKNSEIKKVYVDHVDGNKINNWPDNLVLSCCKCNMHRIRTFKSRSDGSKKASRTNNGPGKCSVCEHWFSSRMSYTGHTGRGCKDSRFIAS